MFLHPLYNAFGLDIGDLSIKIVQLKNASYIRRRPRYTIAQYRSAPLPPGLIVNGELQQPEEVRKHILELMAGKKQKTMKGHWVVASIPESQSFIKRVPLESKETNLSEADIIAIAKHHIPFEETESYIDWQFIPANDDVPASILIGATPKKVSDSYTYLLESLGLGVIAIEMESVAITRSMITFDKEYDKEARLLLDIGATGTSAILYDHDSVQFSTSLPFSGELMTTVLEQKLQLPHAEAEEEKRKQGISFNKGTAWPIIAGLVDQFAEDIKKTLDFYYSHFANSNRVTRITLSGGVANATELGSILSTKLGIETAIGNPWKNLTVGKQKKNPDSAIEYATAIGLALRAADNPLLIHDGV